MPRKRKGKNSGITTRQQVVGEDQLGAASTTASTSRIPNHSCEDPFAITPSDEEHRVISVQQPFNPGKLNVLRELADSLRSASWLRNQLAEPPISADEPIVLHRILTPQHPTRFLAFVEQRDGRRHCVLRHDVKGKLCQYSSVKEKDCLAHLCKFFGYQPLGCEGSDDHSACTKRFSTVQQRDDHYRKTVAPPEPQVTCPICQKPIGKRNLARHIREVHP